MINQRGGRLRADRRHAGGVRAANWTPVSIFSHGPSGQHQKRWPDVALLAPFGISGKMSDLSPQSDPKRTSLRPNSPIAIYEYTP
jgi:hypothetical protein